MVKKSICILANSIKFGGRCVAGVEVIQQLDGKWELTDNWVRPLGYQQDGSLIYSEYVLDTNLIPNILDIVDIHLECPVPSPGHLEDWLIVQNSKWIFRGHFALDVAQFLLQTPNNLWLENAFQTDRVTTAYLLSNKLPSLYLIRPTNLEIFFIETHYKGQATKKRRIRFIYNEISYDLALTDPKMQQKYFSYFPSVSNGILSIGPASNSIICVSLTPPLNGYHYKLVATVLE